ncbi:MAG: 50S ribosomal protein L4 [Candidatus Dojkabacteria bacterium]|nr:50S ribosomal protein L4 [Candidatus Dojkabacteria bacterium]MDQ7021387.1 50S ribosomal protein L4 [Candidatus Dojkabacteria bacterium]
MKVAVYNQKGVELEKMDIDDSVFGVEVNDKVISQYVYSYLSNQRQSNAHTKDRSEVRGGGAKPWRQKGTGRARFGSSRNPIWRKGGVAFGPTNERNWKKKMNKSFLKSAMRNALSSKLATDMKVVDSIVIDEKSPMTKQALEVKSAFENPNKMTIITAEVNKTLINSFSNIQKSHVRFIGELNAYDILNGGLIVIEKEAVELLNKKLSK